MMSVKIFRCRHKLNKIFILLGHLVKELHVHLRRACLNSELSELRIEVIGTLDQSFPCRILSLTFY